jgi:transcriptional regulator with XRE-family HTH domain
MKSIMSWDKLSDEVRKRRRELGLTQPDIQQRGGPGVATLRAIENNQPSRPSLRMRRALEDALEWESGSVDAILAGGAPTPKESKDDSDITTQPKADAEAQDRFSLAKQVVALKITFAQHAAGVSPEARDALLEQITRSTREAEQTIVKVMPWLDDAERGEAIELLVALRAPL